MGSRSRLSRAARGLTLFLSIGTGATLHAACYGATQVELRIATDLACRTATARGGAEIYVAPTTGALASSGERETVAVASQCVRSSAASAELGTLVIVPSGERDESMVVLVMLRLPSRLTACRPPSDIAGCIVATRRVRFIPHRALSLPITLFASCDGVLCGQDETCDRGRCISSDATLCRDDQCDVVRPDDGTNGDGGPLGDGALREGQAGDAASLPGDGEADSATCPPRIDCPGGCAPPMKCCAVDRGGLRCAVDCQAVNGSDQVCSSSCKCPRGQFCFPTAECSNISFCDGQCSELATSFK